MMNKWQKNVFELTDQLISVIIDNEYIAVSKQELFLLNKIVLNVKEKYPDFSAAQIQASVKKIIASRLPHPAAVLCFPGLKEKIVVLLQTYEEMLTKELAPIPKLSSTEMFLKALFPHHKLLKNYKIGVVPTAYFVPSMKLAFIYKEQYQKFKASIRYYNKHIGLKFIVLENLSTHHDLKRSISRHLI
ncbi:MAG: hypothetical protein SCK28_02935 [Bacillota bacterium]|nr:hypothetical protein [Bacillota bacterium]